MAFFLMSLSQNVHFTKVPNYNHKRKGIKLRWSDHYKGQLKKTTTFSLIYVSPCLYMIHLHLTIK